MELFEHTRPILIAHRGASSFAPENTLAAFELAVQQGADAIELDAKLSSDGQVVVIHDQTVDRTTPNSGYVKDFTCTELVNMDAGSHFDIAFRDEKIPRLADVFEAVGQKIFINVELTNYASVSDNLPAKVAALVEEYNLFDRVFFSSFNPIALVRIRRLLPDALIGLLALPGWPGSWARSFPGRLLAYDSLNIELRDVTVKLVHHIQGRDKKILVYTVNQEKDIRHCFDLGVDGIFSDNPVLAGQLAKIKADIG